MYQIFDSQIKDIIKEFISASDDMDIYKIQVSKKKKSNDHILSVTGASKVIERKLKYNLDKKELMKNKKYMMPNSKIDRYSLKNPLDLEEINISFDESSKILSENYEDTSIRKWKLSNESMTPVWSLKYTNKNEDEDKLLIDARSGLIIE